MNTLDKVRKAPVAKCMGIEIETTIGSQAYYNNIRKYHSFFYAGNDGSIDADWGMKGIEFVSQPMPYDWLKKEIAKLYKKFAMEANSSCGIHVHVSKKWLSDKKAREIYTVVSRMVNEDLVHVFGRGINSYTNEPIGDRYCLVNIKNKHTNEFRMFKSGNEKWAQYCVDCAKYMVDHAHHLSIDGLLAFRDMYSF